MAIQDTLNTVISKVAANRVNVKNALAQAEATIVQADDEAVAAAKVLIEKFGNPQGAIQILQNVAQVDAFRETLEEMNAMIAGLEVLLTHPASIEDAAKALTANAETADSPLSQPASEDSSLESADAAAGEAASAPSA